MVMNNLKQEIEQAIADICKQVFNTDAAPNLTRPDEQFGDYATNVALQIAKQLKGNPREIAETIKDKLQHPAVSATEVAGPGFINLRLNDEALLAQAGGLLTKSREGMNAVIETNNPNPFKAMHIGHAFNAILADTIANLLENDGALTHRVSYHGDIGAHVGRSMYSLLKFVEGDASKLENIALEERNKFMSRMYAEGAKAYKEDEAARMEIEELTKMSFSRDDKLYAQVYDICLRWSLEQIDETVARLGNKPVERRFLESDAEVRGVEIVRRHTPAIFQESDGALVFPGSKYGAFDNVFVSARGTGLYAARDLGLMQLKNEYYHPNKSYIVTAEEQRDYFKGVIAAAELCLPELAGVTENITTGTVKLSTGKMSSRSGEVIEIDWLFERIAEAIKERGGEPTDPMIAGALRYQFLKVRIGSDVVFDVNESVSLQGNSGPYLQYAHARGRSILRKAGATTEVQSSNLQLNPYERTLTRKLGEYAEIVSLAAKDLLPHHICTYLYELAQLFNRFYEHNQVIGSPEEAQRLKLVAIYTDTLKHGLKLLGIPAPEKM